jgi:hypothetical protein
VATVAAVAAVAALVLGAAPASASAVPAGRFAFPWSGATPLGGGAPVAAGIGVAAGPCSTPIGASGQGATGGTASSVCMGGPGLSFVGPAIGQIATVIGPTIMGPAVIGASAVGAGNIAIGTGAP